MFDSAPDALKPLSVQSTGNSIPRLFSFVGDSSGPWVVDHIDCVAGEPMPAATHVSVVAGPVAQLPPGALWTLRGITSNERYVVRDEKSALVKRQEGLGRPASTRAALIPIRKNLAWWALAQDERREVFEAQSHHVAIGLKYLPAVARRLHHCRDLGPSEPFDFLTWFEYAPSDSAAFDELVSVLRESPEWQYVDREIDIRLAYAEP
jgi:Chlorite dismutase